MRDYPSSEDLAAHITALFPDGEGEQPVLLVTKDADGDFILRDLTRPGLITHADTEEGVLAQLADLQLLWDSLP